MKEILLLMARYNKYVNVQLYDLLEQAGTIAPEIDDGSYFGNILGLLNHVLVSDLAWLAAYRDSDIDLSPLNSPVLDFVHPGWKKNLYGSLGELRGHRELLDDLMVTFIETTPEEVFLGDITVTHTSGISRTFPFGPILMHFFNHQTHHRGAISQILDEGDVENDYSNLMRMLMD